jgi:2-polyprenyl-3-methyl-5-hydroxy-6-metoxy-1,4-benzoquinol methylase
MNSLQSAYFDITANQFSQLTIAQPLLSQLLEMNHLKSQLALPRGATIVDFGCGSGRLSIYFLSQGYRVYAVDISEKSLASLAETYRHLRQSGWGKLTLSSTLPLITVDGIVGSDILHHVRISEVLPQLYRVLKPGGRIAFSEPNACNLFWYLHYFFNRIPWKIESGITQNTYFNLISLLLSHHFVHVRLVGHGLLPTRIFNFSLSLCKLNCLFLGNFSLFRLLAYRYLILAEK